MLTPSPICHLFGNFNCLLHLSRFLLCSHSSHVLLLRMSYGTFLLNMNPHQLHPFTIHSSSFSAHQHVSCRMLNWCTPSLDLWTFPTPSPHCQHHHLSTLHFFTRILLGCWFFIALVQSIYLQHPSHTLLVLFYPPTTFRLVFIKK